MKKFKVAIDVSPLNDGNSKRGVGYYTRHLVDALQKEVKNNPDYRHYQISLIEDPQSKTQNFDLLHYPYFDPFKLTLPKSDIPQIVTCHDLIPRAFKKHFPVGLKGEIKWLIQKRRLENAAYILCPSHSAKYQILDHLKYPAEKIYVTYEAATANFKPRNNKALLQKIAKKYNLPKKFVLFVGDVNWNKNVPGLTKACLALNYPLVIAGGAATKEVPNHPWTQDILWLQSQARKHQGTKKLQLLGFVPDEDLPLLYNLATIYCQASFSEGFGLTLVEAMQSGTPVAYSQDSCLPEIMDFSGEFFDPYSQASIRQALKKLWTSASLCRQYSLLGQKRAKFFSWQNTALSTLAVYRLVEFDEKK